MMDCTDGVPDMAFKVDSLENSMLEIQKETNIQHTKLKELRERHAKLKGDLQRKTLEMQDRKQKNMVISEDLKLEEFRIKELKETYQAELEVTEASRSEVKKIQDQLQTEKDNQIESLKLYEKRMADLAECFREGPKHYDRKNMTKKMRNLENISAVLQKEIESNSKKINDFTNKYNKMASEGTVFTTNSSYLIKMLEEDLDRMESKETPFLVRAMKSLDKLIADQKRQESNTSQSAAK